MKCLLVVPLLLLLHYVPSVKSDSNVYCKTVEVPDFYWREYNGVIPFDAIEGGRDTLGRPTYVGQAAVFKIGNIPATIYHDNSSAVTSSENTIYVNRNVKILCSGSVQKFKWVATDTDKMSLITNCIVVPGGLDFEDMAYIARVQYEGEVKIGKVLKKWNGILIPDNTGKETILKNFELLVFDCKEDRSGVAVPSANVTSSP